MDPSALIFVALAVAWAVYLVPKAVRHHDEAARSRSVERFSETMRVLARREPVGSRDSRLVVSPGRAAPSSVVTTKERPRPAVEPPVADAAPSPAVPAAARRAASARAAKRRRTVLLAILAAVLLTAVVAATGVIALAWVAAPVAVLVAWLVTCRLAVRSETGLADAARERRHRRREERDEARAARSAAQPTAQPDAPQPDDEGDHTEEIARVAAPTADADADADAADAAAGLWDPVPVTLPTYVDKERATSRTVRTIDLDSTGVWTSGRSRTDSALAREAEDAERAERAQRAEDAERAEQQRRASGS